MAVVIKVQQGGMAGVMTATEKAILAALTGVGDLLTGRKMRLFKNDFTPGKADSDPAAYTEADFTGYAASGAITWGTPMVDANGAAIMQGGATEFHCSGTAVLNTIYGAYLTDDPATVVYDSFRFDTPIEIAAVDDGIVVMPVFSFEVPVLLEE